MKFPILNPARLLLAATIVQNGSYAGQSTDVYVWDGGVSGPPGAAIGVHFTPDSPVPEAATFWGQVKRLYTTVVRE